MTPYPLKCKTLSSWFTDVHFHFSYVGIYQLFSNSYHKWHQRVIPTGVRMIIVTSAVEDCQWDSLQFIPRGIVVALTTFHWKLRVVRMPTLSSLVSLVPPGSDNKVGILTTLDFQCLNPIGIGSTNLRNQQHLMTTPIMFRYSHAWPLAPPRYWPWGCPGQIPLSNHKLDYARLNYCSAICVYFKPRGTSRQKLGIKSNIASDRDLSARDKCSKHSTWLDQHHEQWLALTGSFCVCAQPMRDDVTL